MRKHLFEVDRHSEVKSADEQIKGKISSMVELALEIRNIDKAVSLRRTPGDKFAMFDVGSAEWDFIEELARAYKVKY